MVPGRKNESWDKVLRLPRTWLMEIVEMSRESMSTEPFVMDMIWRRTLRRELLPLECVSIYVTRLRGKGTFRCDHISRCVLQEQ